MSPPNEPARAQTSRPLPVGLGRYQLLRELGSGGMATVYLGKMQLAEGLERLVAVKTIHDELADEGAFIDMFLDEARIASLISHPNVCSVHDFGQEGDTYYLTMEYLVGEPLSAIVRELWDHKDERGIQSALPYMAARIVADACEGLHAAHETRGQDGQRLEVVHRDVSPQNLFVTYEGAVKVVDFGCAHALQRITETSAGIFKGKVAYAAPEQLKIDRLTARTDIWALGACLWETLTLERLFKRDSPMKTARAILGEPIPRADEGRPWVPAALADICERALTRNPVGRYSNAREMGRALRTFIAGSGSTFESAELAEWLGYLFGDRRERLLRMVQEAEASMASHVTVSLGTGLEAENAGGGEALAQDFRPGALTDSVEPTLPLRDSFPGPPSEDATSPLLGWGPPSEEPTVERPELDEVSAMSAPIPLGHPVLVPATAVSGTGPTELEEFDDDVTTKHDPRRAGPNTVSVPAVRPLRLRAEDRAEGQPRRRASITWALLSAALIVAVGVAVSWAVVANQGNGAPVRAASSDLGRGTVQVRASGGWAEVFEGDERLGRTPFDVQLSAGRHVLRVRGFDRGGYDEVDVFVQPDITQRVTVRARR